MKKTCYAVLLCFCAGLLFSGSINAQDLKVIAGTVEEIAPDGTYIVVAGQKIMTTKEFLEDSLLEAGDNVEITVEAAKDGMSAVDYDYVFEEDSGD